MNKDFKRVCDENNVTDLEYIGISKYCTHQRSCYMTPEEFKLFLKNKGVRNQYLHKIYVYKCKINGKFKMVSYFYDEHNNIRVMRLKKYSATYNKNKYKNIDNNVITPMPDDHKYAVNCWWSIENHLKFREE